MEGRRPGVSGGAGRRPISPRPPERRGRGPPGALGSPAAFPCDILPGRKEGKGQQSLEGADTRTLGGTPPTWPLAPPVSASLLSTWQDSPDHPVRALGSLSAQAPGQARGRDAPLRTRDVAPHHARPDFTSFAARRTPGVSAPGGSLRGRARAPPSCRGAEVRSVGGAGPQYLSGGASLPSAFSSRFFPESGKAGLRGRKRKRGLV